ncbi:hypothetical protein ASF10_08080 [Flavobacterium sp. Leaf82]|uniref:hypothetical protein n=1 Tax=unclassified Flavobacterium TaxID=196869 RepID=UPI0006F6D18C|nr:hypothetical protein [Flavobacterium sp. Leaf82]KQO22336.1 hypothetical protein ASF10_08080 [Flavobacterium sp. Leaf82]
MKKILTLFAIVGLIVFSSCEGPEGPQGPEGPSGEISYVFEVNNVTFDANGNGVLRNFGSTLFSGDVVLIYRLTGTSNGRDVWAPIPESHYYDDGTLFFTYKYNFSQLDFEIYLEGFELNTIPANLRANQTFRIVIVPGDDGVNTKKSVSKPDYSDYNAVIKKYNIDDSNVKKLN